MSDIKEIPNIPLATSLLLTMLFPEQNELALARESVWAIVTSSHIRRLTEDRSVQVDAEVIRRIEHALTWEQIGALFNNKLAFQYGNISGMIVNFVLSAASCRETRRYASVTTAARCLYHQNRRERGFSVANIQDNIWPKFRPVASLWAAHHLYCSEDERFKNVSFWKENEAVLIFSRAMKIQEMGETFKPLHSTTTLLLRTCLFGRYRAIAGSAADFVYGRLPQQLIDIAGGR